jgi:hypothetical protein
MKIHRTFVLTSQDVPELVNGIQVRPQESTQKTLFETKEVEQCNYYRGHLFRLSAVEDRPEPHRGRRGLGHRAQGPRRRSSPVAGATVGGLWGGAGGIEGRYFVDFADPEEQRLRLANDGEEGVAGLPGGITWEGSTVPPEMG